MGATSAAPAGRDALRAAIDAALADAARRTGRSAAALTVVSAEAVIWPDGSLGCGHPGAVYTMAPVAGQRIRIAAGDTILDYHGGEGGQLVFCEPGRGGVPLTGDR